jgi:tryptophanase
LAVALYLEGGIRSCEIGSVMFGMQSDGSEIAAPMELVRMALPRRVYTQSHADYVVEVFETIARDKDKMRGMKIVWQPHRMRHFSAKFAPL